MCVIFFFQAEDGIRALYVTGVQTCALPIYPGLDREDRWRLHVDDVNQASLELAVDGRVPGAVVIVDLRDDRNPGEPEQFGQHGAGRGLHRVARLDAREDEIRALGPDRR